MGSCIRGLALPGDHLFMHTTGRTDTRWQRVTRAVSIATVTVGMLIPAMAQAQVTAYAVIPSWTQNKVLVRDAHSGAAVASIPLAGEPYDAAITADGRYAYVTLRASHQVAVIDLGTMQVVTTIAMGLEPRGIVIPSNDTRAWVTEAGSHTVSTIDLLTKAVIGAPIPVGAMPWGIAVRPQGDRAYVVNRADSTVSAIDLVTQTVVAVMPVDQEPVEIIIAPDGSRAYVTSTIANTVVPIDLDTHTVQPSIPVGLFPRDLAITPNGKQIFVADSDSGTVSVIDTPSHTVIDTIPLGANSIPSGVDITPDGRHVLVGTQTFTLRIIDAASHTLLSTIPVGGQALRLTSTASMVVPDPQGAILSIANDADFAPLGFGSYITFRKGVLRATNDIFTLRHVSLLPQGGTIDTQHFNVQIAGETVNDGTLAKRGSGTLTLSGNNMHPSTHVFQGTLSVLGTHNGSVRLGTAGTLAGTGTVVYVDASQGVINPGVNAPGDLYAGDVMMSPSHSLVVELNGVMTGQYDRLLATGSVSINGAKLVVIPGAMMPKGSTFTIVTNANGQFAGLPEGAMILTVFGKFRISYIGGPTQTDVVLRAF